MKFLRDAGYRASVDDSKIALRTHVALLRGKVEPLVRRLIIELDPFPVKKHVSKEMLDFGIARNRQRQEALVGGQRSRGPLVIVNGRGDCGCRNDRRGNEQQVTCQGTTTHAAVRSWTGNAITRPGSRQSRQKWNPSITIMPESINDSGSENKIGNPRASLDPRP